MTGNHRTVGLISTMSPDSTWAQQVLDRVAASHGLVKDALEDMGFGVLDEGSLHRSYEEMKAAGGGLRARGIRALVLQDGTWTYANCAAAAALEADLARVRETAPPIPPEALDCHTPRGRKAGKTKADFFREEHAALSPRQPGLFDKDVEKL